VDLLAAPSIAALAVAVLLRLRWSEGRDRAELRCALGGLVVVPLALALSVGATLATGDDYMHLVLPFAVLAIPLSIAYALVRHNILRTEAVLTPAFFFVPIAVVTSIATLGTWLVLSSWPSIGRVPSLLSSAAAFFGVGFGLVRLTSCHLFAARQQFRPTIEMLSDELANLRDPEAVRGALEKVVLRWLPTSKVRVLHLAELRTGVPDLPPGWEAALASGERVWTTRDPWSRELLVPLRSLGKLRGALLVGPKRQGALYTDQDLALLDTIATLGAAAVHNAEVIRELEAFRRLEVEAARDEKRHALGLLGAEISHEISYSLNFFRYLMEQSGQGTALSQQDVEIGQEEVERLQRMLVTLRRLKAPAAANEPVQIARPLNRALRLIHDLLESGGIRVVNEVPEDARVVASSDSLVQVFANLLRNAAQAAGPGGEIGVRLIETPESSFIEIWDSGAGLSPDLASVAFNPWVTTKADGSGLGLAVTQRIVRSYGWTISFCRHQERTIFRLELPAHPGAERTPTPEPTP
jgi:signal transduction histidine kinase